MHKGIKETQEALLAIAAVGKFVVDRMKDGVDLDDAVALAGKLANDPEFVSVIKAGVEGIKDVPEELGDLSFIEMFQLAQIVPDLLKVFQK